MKKVILTIVLGTIGVLLIEKSGKYMKESSGLKDKEKEEESARKANLLIERIKKD